MICKRGCKSGGGGVPGDSVRAPLRAERSRSSASRSTASYIKSFIPELLAGALVLPSAQAPGRGPRASSGLAASELSSAGSVAPAAETARGRL